MPRLCFPTLSADSSGLGGESHPAGTPEAAEGQSRDPGQKREAGPFCSDLTILFRGPCASAGGGAPVQGKREQSAYAAQGPLQAGLPSQAPRVASSDLMMPTTSKVQKVILQSPQPKPISGVSTKYSLDKPGRQSTHKPRTRPHNVAGAGAGGRGQLG